jgi:undecaprenyl-diphosphatase
MATGLYLANRTIGLIALAHAAFIICLPRVYFGLHFVSDVVVGGLIGSAMILLLAPWMTRRLARTNTVLLSESHPQFFYPALIFVTWQLAQLFDPLRNLAEGLLDVLAA